MQKPAGESGSWTHTTRIDEAVELCGRAYYPHTLSLLDASREFFLTQRITRIGPITIGDATYGTDVGLDFGELNSYQVALPVSGFLESRHRGAEATATSELATIFQPEGEAVVTRWHANSRILPVRLGRAAVHEALGSLLGHPDIVSIPFAATMDTMRGLGRSWARSIRTLSRTVAGPDDVLTHPLITAPLSESLIRGLLLAADHPYRHMLIQHSQPPRDRVVRTAVEMIEASPRAPLTISMLAKRSHVSVRALQLGFRRHLDMSPMAYVRMVRLRHAHEELRAADPSRTTVTSIAHRWGFSNVGRFADEHASKYGELPSETLRRTR